MFPYIDLGFHQLPMYGLMLALGFFAATFVSARRAAGHGLATDAIWDLAVILILSGLAGGRLLYVALHFDYFLQNPWQIILSRTDFVFFGGAIAAFLAGWLYCRWKKLDVWRVGDCAAPGAALGHALGRIGCFMQGCCHGVPCTLPWAVRYPPNSDSELFTNPAFYHHVQHFGLSPDAPYSLPVHPTQLYEAGANLAIFGLLLWLSRRQRFSGQVFLAYLVLYGIARFTVEIFRGDLTRGGFGPLSTSQWIALGVVALGVWFWRQRRGIALDKAA